MNSTAMEGTGARAAGLDEHFEAILINAQLYSEMGFDMHLCHGINADGSCTCRWGVGCGRDTGKHPRRSNWQKLATHDVNKLAGWLRARPVSNLGIKTGNGLVVIDVDPKHGGFETLAKLEAVLGHLPRRHVVRTGSGGIHIYLAVSPVNSCRIGSFEGGEGRGLGPGVDVKARGGQVIAAPSRHLSGNCYKWETLSAEPLSKLPDCWTARLLELSPQPTFTKKRPRRPIRRRQRRKQQDQPQGRLTGQQRSNVAGAVCNITGCVLGDDVVSRVGNCLIRCQVTGKGKTNTAIYRLACGLRNIPELANKSAKELKPLIAFWFNVGKANMSKAGWGTVWKRWVYTWGFMSETQVGPAWDAANELDTPSFRKEAEQSEHAGMFILKAICTHIHAHAREGRWFLTCRTAADVLSTFGVEITHMTTSRWIKALVAEGFLKKDSYRDESSHATQWYVIAAAAARCEERKLRDADAMLTAGKDLAAVLQVLEVSESTDPVFEKTALPQPFCSTIVSSQRLLQWTPISDRLSPPIPSQQFLRPCHQHPANLTSLSARCFDASSEGGVAGRDQNPTIGDGQDFAIGGTDGVRGGTDG